MSVSRSEDISVPLDASLSSCEWLYRLIRPPLIAQAVINLDNRPDRLLKWQQVWVCAQPWWPVLKYQAFEAAAYGCVPHVACSLSHSACLQEIERMYTQQQTPHRALSPAASWCWITEDDACLRPTHEWSAETVEALAYLGRSWSSRDLKDVKVVMLGHNPVPYGSDKARNLVTWCSGAPVGLKRVRGAYCGSCYLVRRSYIATLRSTFRAGRHQRPTPVPLDVAWLGLQKRDVWLAVDPSPVFQRPDFSDIEQKAVAYGV